MVVDDRDAVRVRRDAHVRAARIKTRLHIIRLEAAVDALVVGRGAEASRVAGGPLVRRSKAVLEHLVKVSWLRVVATGV